MSVVTVSPSCRQLQETTMDQASDVFVTNADDELLGAMKTAALADDAPRMNQLLAKFYEHSEQLQEVGRGVGGGWGGGGRGLLGGGVGGSSGKFINQILKTYLKNAFINRILNNFIGCKRI